jgi:hypothetical protein
MAHHDELSYFIISKDFTPKEDENLEFLNFYDFSKMRTFKFIINEEKEKLYLCLKPENFGSVFFGNYLYKEFNAIILTEINPMYLLINLFHALKCESKENKYCFMEINDLIQKHIETLYNTQKELGINELVVESTIKILYFLQNLFSGEKSCELELICEKNYNSFNQTNYFKLAPSKLINHFNNKLKIIESDKEKLKEVTSIISNFLPDELEEMLIKFKSLDMTIKDEKQERAPDVKAVSPIKENKRKNLEEEKVKDVKKTNNKHTENKKKVEVDPNQINISNFFKKKDK